MRLAGSMGYWVVRGRAREIQSALLQLLSRSEAAVYPAARALALFAAGALTCFTGSFAQANILLEDALTLARTIGDSELAAYVLCYRGMGCFQG